MSELNGAHIETTSVIYNWDFILFIYLILIWEDLQTQCIWLGQAGIGRDLHAKIKTSMSQQQSGVWRER